jgi:hypothetical protein
MVKKLSIILLFTFYFLLFTFQFSSAQCSICTKTAQQMGEQPARGLNGGILYLAFTPFAIGIFVGYRWWRSNREQ